MSLGPTPLKIAGSFLHHQNLLHPYNRDFFLKHKSSFLAVSHSLGSPSLSQYPVPWPFPLFWGIVLTTSSQRRVRKPPWSSNSKIHRLPAVHHIVQTLCTAQCIFISLKHLFDQCPAQEGTFMNFASHLTE